MGVLFASGPLWARVVGGELFRSLWKKKEYLRLGRWQK